MEDKETLNIDTNKLNKKKFITVSVVGLSICAVILLIFSISSEKIYISESQIKDIYNEYVDIGYYTKELPKEYYDYDISVVDYSVILEDGSRIYTDTDYNNLCININKLSPEMELIFEIKIDFKNLDDISINKILELNNGNLLVEYLEYDKGLSFLTYNSNGELISTQFFENIYSPEIYCNKEYNNTLVYYTDNVGEYLIRYDNNFNEIFNLKLDEWMITPSYMVADDKYSYIIIDYFIDDKECVKLIKIDNNKNYIYEKIIYEKNNLSIDNAIITSDEGLLLFGKEYLGEYITDESSCIIKVNKNGDVQWIKEFDNYIDNYILKELDNDYLMFNIVNCPIRGDKENDRFYK